MSRAVLLALIVETALMTATVLLLTQPGFFPVRARTDRGRAVATALGMMLLCVTFCWSVVFGCVLALSRWSVAVGA